MTETYLNSLGFYNLVSFVHAPEADTFIATHGYYFVNNVRAVNGDALYLVVGADINISLLRLKYELND